MAILPRAFNPLFFQGKGKKQGYFERWYFKQSVPRNRGLEQRSIAIVPGISLDPQGKGYAFIQTIDSQKGSSCYVRFPIDTFSFQDKPFRINIGENTFSLEGLHLDISDDRIAIVADLEYHHIAPIRPIMGPYNFIPFIGCKHSIISIHHRVDGHITIIRKNHEGELLSFSDGSGYIEKDWGRSIPSSRIWIQADGFETSLGPVSFFFSLSHIPWMNLSYNGYISVLSVDNKEYRFASYRRGHIDLLEYKGNILRILLSDCRYKVEILVRLPQAGKLLAPVQGTLDRRVGECNNAWVRVVVKAKHKASDAPVFDGIATGSGVELVGDIESLSPL